MKLKYFLAVLLLPVLHAGAQVRITGQVSDKNNTPVTDATVILVHSGASSVTDESGRFSLPLRMEADTLVIRHVGFKTSYLSINSSTPKNLSVTLEEQTKELDDVVIIGYGTTTERFNTGSVGKVSGEQIASQPVANPLAALEGRVPGLSVTQNNGMPGAYFKVQIRGQGSLAQGNDPLFVIDGVPYAPNNSPVNQLSSAATQFAGGGLSPFNSISPADIESVEVLKDADATAIYGSRGANGVILITTKKGKAGKTQCTIRASSGISRVTRTMPMLDTRQYLAMRREAFANDGVVPSTDNAPDLLVWDTTRNTDFRKLLIGGTAHASDVQVSLTGGEGLTSFLLSGDYHHETTVFPGDLADNRGSFHAAIQHTSQNRKFHMSLSAIYSSDKNAINSSDLTSHLNLPPDLPPLYDSTGKLNWQGGGVIFDNPLAYLLQKYTAQTDNLLGNLSLSYQLYPGLDLTATAGYNTYQLTELNTNPILSQNPAYLPLGYSEFGNNSFKSWIMEPQLNYRHSFGRLNLGFLAGGTLQEMVNSNSSFFAYGYSNDALLGSIGAASSLSVLANNKTDYRYAALFGRLNLRWNNEWILNFSGRRDGSSRFGPGRQFANFGAVGGAWIFSEQKFIKKILPFLSYGKLRGSYGSTGNDQIGDYQYLDTWTPSPYVYGNNRGLQPSGLFNPEYSWEINRKAEAALELGFAGDRILLNADWFHNRSSNQLLQYTLPLQTGFSSIISNFPATIQNSGFELSLTGKSFVRKNFSWTTTLTLTLPRNKLIAFPGLASTPYANRYVLGKSVNTIRGFQFEGVDPATGVFRFTDQNKDGMLNSQDYVVLGNTDPVFYGGFLNSLQYRNFQLDLFFEFRKQTGSNYLASVYIAYAQTPGTMANQPTAVLDRWQVPGNRSDIQQFTATPGTDAFNALNYLYSSGGVYSDASFIRLKNISLSYSIPENWLKKHSMTGAMVYLRAENLLTITGYKGADPETQNLYSLPPLRTITAGIQFTF